MTTSASRRGPLWTALILATLFHLSMVSVFSIVIWIPHTREQYSAIEIVPPQRRAKPAPSLRLRLANRMPRQLRQEFVPETPKPPAIEVAELPRLQTTLTPEQKLSIRTEFGALLETHPPETPDSWDLFTQQLRNLARRLVGLPPAAVPEQTAAPIQVGNVAPGFNLDVNWLSEPHARRLLFSPPVEALWHTDPAAINDPLTFVFTVAPDGHVLDVQSPVDDAGIASELERALWQYRFEPIEGNDTKDQRGVLVLSTEATKE